MTTLSPGQIASAAYGAGFRGDSLVTAVAIALAESGGRVEATHVNSNKSTDRGLWQINSVHSQYDAGRLLSDPLYNAQAAYEISGGGSNFRPWTTYTSGAYRSHLTAAQGAAPDGLGSGAGSSTSVDLPNPLDPAGLTGLPNPLDLVPNPFSSVTDAVAQAIGSVGEQLVTAGMYFAFTVAALALIGMGLHRLTGTSPVEVFQKTQGAVGTAAAVAAVA